MSGARVGFVPTMGYLHAGHTSLMDIARPQCDQMVASIFVNPLQFGPNEDLDVYPRDPEGDAEKCVAHGVDALFLPEESSFYPDGFVSTVHVDRLTEGLCGAKRPGHFDGVTTVVARLFGLIRPDLAVFGTKDYQQIAVIRQMVSDLALGVEICPGPIVRDADGLALSSRNRFLSKEARRRALTLNACLRAIGDAGERDVAALNDIGKAVLDVDRLDYLEIVDPVTLQPLDTVRDDAQALIAAFVGGTRLIDNLRISRGDT